MIKIIVKIKIKTQRNLTKKRMNITQKKKRCTDHLKLIHSMLHLK